MTTVPLTGRDAAAATNVLLGLDRLAVPVGVIPSDGPCRNHPGLWWSSSRRERDVAVEVCQTRCPSLDACRTVASHTQPVEGVWAGVDLTSLPDNARPFPPATQEHAA